MGVEIPCPEFEDVGAVSRGRWISIAHSVANATSRPAVVYGDFRTEELLHGIDL